jgi:hypothetical protein
VGRQIGTFGDDVDPGKQSDSLIHHPIQVPTLRALLTPEDQRPKVFYRGYDVLDPVNIGFISDGPEAASVGFRRDTSVPGTPSVATYTGDPFPKID